MPCILTSQLLSASTSSKVVFKNRSRPTVGRKICQVCATQILNMCAALIIWTIGISSATHWPQSQDICALCSEFWYFTSLQKNLIMILSQHGKPLLHIQDLFKVDIYQLCFQTCSPKDAGGVGVHSVDHVLLAHPLLLPSPPFQLAKKPTLS